MSHGSHDNCMMCRIARAVGMMEKHPKSCDCEATHPKKKDEQKSEGKVNAAV